MDLYDEMMTENRFLFEFLARSVSEYLAEDQPEKLDLFFSELENRLEASKSRIEVMFADDEPCQCDGSRCKCQGEGGVES